jgi:hypothetical protein
VGSIHPHTSVHGAFGDEDMVLGKIRISLRLSIIPSYLRICSE